MKTEWIKVSERLPKEKGRFLCYSEEGKISMEDFDPKFDSGIYCDSTDSGYATHWAVISPPQE